MNSNHEQDEPKIVEPEVLVDDATDEYQSEDASVPSDTDTVETQDKDAANSELEEIRSQLLRTMADFDNFRRRTRQEKDELQKFAARSMATDLLGVVDNFERALQTWPVDDADSEVRKGIDMVNRQLLSVLERHGVEPMDAVGKPFNPNLHEAVMQEPVEGLEPGTVALELQKGYTMHGKVLRTAMVKVTI